MKSKNTLIGIVLAAMLLLSTAAPAFAADGATNDLSVDVDQGDGAVVTVTSDVTVNDTTTNNTTTTVPVENATVTVDALNNSTYATNGSFETDENGTVVLPDPQENVTVEVTATWNGSTATTTVDLVAAADGDEADDSEDEADPYTFGQRMSDFIHEMLHAGDSDGPLGRLISEFARNNNPGAEKRADHAEKGKERQEKRDEHAEKDRKDKHEKRNEHAKKHEKKHDDEDEQAETTEEETTDDDTTSDDTTTGETTEEETTEETTTAQTA